MTPELPLRPWIGANYATLPKGQRLLLLGESMYTTADKLSPNILSDLIAEQITGPNTWRFYNRVYHTVTGKRRTRSIGDELKAFWDRVSLYNYVQFPLQGGPRTRPTDQQWADSRQLFPTAFAELKPDRAIVFGNQLAGCLMAAGFGERSETQCRGKLVTQAHECPALFIKHPASVGYSAGRWYSEHVADFLSSPCEN
ncbi:MAG: hypothetical protein C0467_02285 [Planctomycetaceae bacterium]|nr:hypothetical protein [Planctomycetaceae bacterium]